MPPERRPPGDSPSFLCYIEDGGSFGEGCSYGPGQCEGAFTLPRALRDQVGLRVGSVVRVRAVNGGLVLEPSGGDVMALAGIVLADRAVSLDDMEEAIRAGACGESEA